jgi:hypothetical protein
MYCIIYCIYIIYCVCYILYYIFYILYVLKISFFKIINYIFCEMLFIYIIYVLCYILFYLLYVLNYLLFITYYFYIYTYTVSNYCTFLRYGFWLTSTQCAIYLYMYLCMYMHTLHVMLLCCAFVNIILLYNIQVKPSPAVALFFRFQSLYTVAQADDPSWPSDISVVQTTDQFQTTGTKCPWSNCALTWEFPVQSRQRFWSLGIAAIYCECEYILSDLKH